jgi:hypothetical protein
MQTLKEELEEQEQKNKEVEGGFDTDERRPLTRRNSQLDIVKDLTNRPVSPDPLDAEEYIQTDICDIPHCPKHGIRSRSRYSYSRRSVSLRVVSDLSGMRTQTMDTTVVNEINMDKPVVNKINMDGTDENNDEHNVDVDKPREMYRLARRVQSEAALTTTPICIKDRQKKLMRGINRRSTDRLVQESVTNMDEVSRELTRRFSAPPRVLRTNSDVH